IASSQHVKTVWLSALSDQHIGASLRSMHETLEHSWTVASLASEAGMSRSAYAQRFKELVGEAPLEYLTRWRMYRASRLLRESSSKLVNVAQAVGYDSDGAFNRAFRRVIGVAPGEYRRNLRDGADSLPNGHASEWTPGFEGALLSRDRKEAVAAPHN